MVEPDMKDLELISSEKNAANLNVPLFLISSISAVSLIFVQH